MVWPCPKVFWFSKDSPARHDERKQKKRWTEEEREDHIKDLLWTGMDFASSTRAAENRTLGWMDG